VTATNQQDEGNNVEAGSMLVRELFAMGIGLLLVYWGKVEGPYLMTFLAYIMGAHYKTPRMTRGAISSTLGGIRASVWPSRFSVHAPRHIDPEREKE
jgi:hypothetical protein